MDRSPSREIQTRDGTVASKKPGTEKTKPVSSIRRERPRSTVQPDPPSTYTPDLLSKPLFGVNHAGPAPGRGLEHAPLNLKPVSLPQPVLSLKF